MKCKTMFSNQPINDERVRGELYKYMAHAYSISFILALGSSFIKAVILRMPLSSYFIEMLIFFIPALYLTVRSILGGIPLFFVPNKRWEKRYVYISVISGSVIFGLLTSFINDDNWIVLHGSINPKGILISFVSAIFFGVFMFVFMRKFNKMAEINAEKKIFNETEEDK